jgi:hypothetical protein
MKKRCIVFLTLAAAGLLLAGCYSPYYDDGYYGRGYYSRDGYRGYGDRYDGRRDSYRYGRGRYGYYGPYDRY